MDLQPLILCLDLDGTLQGNIGPQLEEYQLISKLNKVIVNEKKIRYSNQLLRSDFMNGLLRPDVVQSLRSIKKKHSNVEFFIYTASQHDWAMFILNKLFSFIFDKNEKIINRPYFTRKHCQTNGQKSIIGIKPLIVKSLKNKYVNCSFEHIYLIDNNFVLDNYENNRLIHCPTYNYVNVIDPLRNISPTVVNKYYKDIGRILYPHVIFETKMDLLKYLYKQTTYYHNNSFDSNKWYKSDNYWYSFSNIILYSRIKYDTDFQLLIYNLQRIPRYLSVLGHLKYH